LNDLKGDEFTAPSMGRQILWVVVVLLTLPIVNAGQTTTQMTSDGTAWFDCDDSWASIHDSQGQEVANGSDFTVGLDSQNHTIYVDDNMKCQGVIPLTEELPNLKPAPSDEFITINSTVCVQPNIAACEGTYTSGDLIGDSADVFAINVSENHILVVDLVASSSAIDVELFFQNNTSQVKLEQEFSLSLNTSIGGSYDLYIPIVETGRVIVFVSSPNPDTIWSIKTEIYPTGDIQSLANLDNIIGIGSAPFAVEIGGDESLVITTSSTYDGSSEVPLRYRYVYAESSFSTWNNASVGDRIHGMNGILYIEFQWNCDCKWISSISKSSHFDASWEMDAPGFKPLTTTSNNSTYPLIEMDGHTETGELTLHMGDYQDILRIETTGWNESVHLVEVVVEGDIYELRVTIWNMDQETWDILDEVTATYSMDKISLSMDVGLGTHYIRIQHINGSESLDGNMDSVEWRIRITTAILDEGEEPWFAPSDAVKDAADAFYWLVGIMLILPFLIFYINVNSNKKFAEEFARKKNRLAWLSAKLDDGDFSPTDLSRALKSVSSLEWEEALEVWGQEQVRHYTTGIDMAVWILDSRLAKDGSWPLLIGIRPQDCEWSVAALKFEAPEGEAWNVSKVEPKLLTRGHEIFLDTIHTNSRLFIRVDIQGDADAVDIYLSGMVDGNPMAAKPANTIYRSAVNSEE